MIIGKNVDLVDVTVEDAEFILSLRLNDDLNKYLSRVEDNIENQRNWIKKSIDDVTEHYFIVKNKLGESIGTIRIYNITDKTFCWGSWIIKEDHRRYASLESIVLLYKFAFIDLGFDETNFDVRKENTKALKFYLRFGAVITSENKQDYFLNYKKNKFLNDLNNFNSVINKIEYD